MIRWPLILFVSPWLHCNRPSAVKSTPSQVDAASRHSHQLKVCGAETLLFLFLLSEITLALTSTAGDTKFTKLMSASATLDLSFFVITKWKNMLLVFSAALFTG